MCFMNARSVRPSVKAALEQRPEKMRQHLKPKNRISSFFYVISVRKCHNLTLQIKIALHLKLKQVFKFCINIEDMTNFVNKGPLNKSLSLSPHQTYNHTKKMWDRC